MRVLIKWVCSSMRTLVFVGKVFAQPVWPQHCTLKTQMEKNGWSWRESEGWRSTWGSSTELRKRDKMGMWVLWTPLIHTFTLEKNVNLPPPKSAHCESEALFWLCCFFPLPLSKNGAADIFQVRLRFLNSLVGVCGINLWPFAINYIYLLNRTWGTSGNNNMAVMPYYYERAG